MDVPFTHIRAALRRARFAGVHLKPGALPELYATLCTHSEDHCVADCSVSSNASTAPTQVTTATEVEVASTISSSTDAVLPTSNNPVNDHDNQTPTDWAVLSYVHTNAPAGSHGMPHYVATEAEDVLDALVEVGFLRERAVWLDRAAITSPAFPAVATLQCLCAPVICIPPTRTKEYARYQIPDRWDEAAYVSSVMLEDILRACPTCRKRCPLEWDSRLLNVAATLRAWPLIEAVLGSSARGAFISFTSFDRFAYTIAWMQVLLHFALEVDEFDPTLIDQSIELYGHPLFRPCIRCVSTGKDLMYRTNISSRPQMLEGL